MAGFILTNLTGRVAGYVIFCVPHDFENLVHLLDRNVFVSREERHHPGQRAVEIGGQYRRHDAARVLLAVDERVVAVAFAFGGVSHETFVFQNLEEGGDGGVLGPRLLGLGDDLIDHRVPQTPEYLHDLLFAACEFR